jgi:hypothetical protein
MERSDVANRRHQGGTVIRDTKDETQILEALTSDSHGGYHALIE